MADRDPKTGRFVKGNPGGPGRPRGERQYLDAMINAVSLEDWRKATNKMLTLAIGGDVQAYKAVVPYLAGLPVQKLQLSSADAALLADLLVLLETQGLSASVLFEAMMQEVAQEAATETNDDE